MQVKIRINSERFEKILNDRLLYQEDVATTAGIAPVVISRMKNPKTHGSKGTAKKILKALPGVKFDDIFFVCD